MSNIILKFDSISIFQPLRIHIPVLKPVYATVSHVFIPVDIAILVQEKNHPWLELSDVHKETTENIRVTVIPFYMGFRENQQVSIYLGNLL